MRGKRKSPIRQVIKRSTFGVRTRLVLVVLALVSLGAILNYLVQRDTFRQIVDSKIAALEGVIATSSQNTLAQSGSAGLEPLMKSLMQNDMITSVQLVDLRAGGQTPAATEATPDQVQQRTDALAYSFEVPVQTATGAPMALRIQLDKALLDREHESVTVSSLTAPVIVFLIGIIICFPLANGFTLPLDELLSHTERAANGDFEHAVNLRTNDEFEKLAKSLNTMMGALRTSMRTVHALAYRDGLTGLPNRAWFKMHFEGTVEYFRQREQSVAVLFLDLDRFKQANDTLGHAAGDRLLRSFAKRITTTVEAVLDIEVQNIRPSCDPVASEPEQPAVCRLAGDEFVVLVPLAPHRHNAVLLAEEIVRTLQVPFQLGDTDYIATTSIGISILAEQGSTASTLLKNADAAMYAAKSAGRNQYKVFDAADSSRFVDQIVPETEMIAALDQDQFEVFFQPQFDVQSGGLVGAEALVRWQHPERGLLNPDDFLPQAETYGLMPQIGRKVISMSLEHARNWPVFYDLPPLRLSVNATFDELSNPLFVDHVLAELTRTGFDAGQLDIEISERIAMSNENGIEGHLNRLRAAGVRFAVDDFGVGYSNLGRLKELEFDVLKVDRSLMTDVGADQNAETIVSTIFAMCDALKLRVVAEGIEKHQQLEFLRKVGCGEAQGFSLARPMSADAFFNFVANQRLPNALTNRDLLAS